MTASTRNYIVRRLLLVVPMLIGLSIVVFLLIHLAPGDPALALVGEQNVDPTVVAQVRKNLGLDKPLPVQYGIWLSNIVQLDFGTAYTFNRTPVIELIRQRLSNTVELQALAIAVSLVVAIPLGIISARRQYSALDNVATGGSFLGLAMPNFWLALLLQLFLAVQLGWLPPSGSTSDGEGLGKLRYFVMPTIVLAVPTIAVFTRFMRSSMLEVIRQDYITTARAKGLSERIVLYRHAVKNALIPMVTVLGTQLPRLLSGSVIVEFIFAWPGLGSLAYQSILQRDYPVILALTMLTGSAILLINVLVDVAYVFLDPRIAFD